MPFLIGPEEHRSTVANALFSIIDHGGVEAATSSRLTRETDLPEETVHSHFSNPVEMLIFIREVIYQRLTKDLEPHTSRIIDDDPKVTAEERRAAVENALHQLLPLDEERRKQSRVWLECSSYAARNPDLEPHTRLFAQSMREGFPKLIRVGQDVGLFAENLDAGVESERLISLVEGLTLNAALRPTFVSTDSMLMVLRRHLDELQQGG